MSVLTPAAHAGIRASSTAHLVGDLAAVSAVVLLFANVPVLAADQLGLPATAAAVVVPGLLVVAAICRSPEELRTFPRPAPLPWLLGFMAVVVLAALLSPVPAVAADGAVAQVTEGLVLYLLVLLAVRDVSTLRRCTIALVLTAGGLALLSILQTATGAFHQDFLGLAQHGATDLELGADGTHPPVRVGGPIGEKNRYAQHLLMVLPLALVAAVRLPRRAERVAAGAVALACVVAVALTLSRGAAVAAVALLVTMVVIREVGPRVLLVAAAVGAVAVLALPGLGERLVAASPALRGPTAVTEADGAVQGRLSSNIGSMRVFLDNPVLGVGPGAYPMFHRDAVIDLGLRVVPEREPHSLPLGLGAETGLLGLLMFAGLLLATIRPLWLTRRGLAPTSTRGLLASGFLLGLLAYVYAGVFLHLAYVRYFWLVMALAALVPFVKERS